MDNIHNCKWVYYSRFEDMLEKFQTFEYKEQLNKGEMDKCWSIFSVRYITDNWKTLTISDYEERHINCITEYLQINPHIEDHWNSDIFTANSLLRNYIHHVCYYKLLNELNSAAFDSVYLTRTKEEWKLIYQARYQMIPHDNLWFDRIYMLQTQEENSYYHKFRDISKITHLMANPQALYVKRDVGLEFFPRERSRPKHDYAYVRYWIDNGEIKVVPNLLSVREKLDKNATIREELYNKVLETWSNPKYMCIIC